MKSLFRFRFAAGGALLLALTGCGVYAPHISPTPIVERGQLEAKLTVAPLMSLETASIRPKPSPWIPAVEGYVAVSPLPHVLVVGSGGTNYAGALRPGATDYRRERQADIGLGYYRRSGEWYLAGLVGIGGGQEATSRQDASDSFFRIGGGSSALLSTRYDYRYRQAFVQGYAAFTESIITICFSARVAQLTYRDIAKTRTRDGEIWQASTLPARLATTSYLEPCWSLRLGQKAWQGVAEMGLSMPLYRPTADPKNDNTRPSSTLLMTVGVVYRPQLWGKRAPTDWNP